MKTYSKLLTLLFFCFFTNILSADELINLTADQLRALQKKNALVIDIRTVKEWQETGIIPGSHKIEFYNENGDYNIERWLSKLKTLRQSPEQPVILVCRSGNRSKTVGELLTQKLAMKNIYHLEHGMSSWIKEGNKTDKTCSVGLACNNN